MTKYISTLVLIFVAMATSAQVDSTLVDSVKVEPILYDNIEDDPHYTALREEHSRLLECEDSLRIVIAEARDNYSESRGDGEENTASNVYIEDILNHEKQMFDVRASRRAVVRNIAQIEQQYHLRDISNVGRVVAEDDYNVVRGDRAEHAQLVHNSIIAANIEKPMNVHEISPYRVYAVCENMPTNIGKQHPAIIDASET